MTPKIVDCTLRDGGLVNNFFFNDDFTKHLYEANIKSGIDYMEFGYKASKKLFSKKEYGKWKFCDEEDLRTIVDINKKTMKISVMADVGRCDYREDIIPRKYSVIDMIRIASYANTISEAITMIEYCHQLGYETTINLMAVSTTDSNTLIHALSALKDCPVDVIYLVDSYGALYPCQIQNYINLYSKYCSGKKKLGIHAHNNQQLAFANTLEAYQLGTEFLDVTINSLGRGAGNCPSELLINAIKENNVLCIDPILQFIEEYILELKKQGLNWGYDIPYLITGIYNQHPSSAIQFINEEKHNYNAFNQNVKQHSFIL